MTGIEKIIARIEADAQAEAAAILAESRESCAAAKAEYDKKAQDEYARLVRSGVRDCETRVSRLGSTADMEARKSVLSLKQDMVSLAFQRARELLCALPEDQYVAFLAKQAADAARTGLEQVIFNQRDQAVADKIVSAANALLRQRCTDAKLTVSPATRPIMGGLIVKDGDIETNCSVEALTELRRGALASEVAAVMFG